MSKLTFDITTSLDGFVAGPNQTLEEPLGRGGEQLHDWVVVTAAWRERHGLEGGEANADSEVVAEGIARQGAVVMGRRMFSGGGAVGGRPEPRRLVGRRAAVPPGGVYPHPPPARDRRDEGRDDVHVRDRRARGRPRAGPRGRRRQGRPLAGGGSTIQQALAAGVVDDFQLHVAPVLLGGGVRLFDDVGGIPFALKPTRVVESPNVTHIRYEVQK